MPLLHTEQTTTTEQVLVCHREANDQPRLPFVSHHAADPTSLRMPPIQHLNTTGEAPHHIADFLPCSYVVDPLRWRHAFTHAVPYYQELLSRRCIFVFIGFVCIRGLEEQHDAGFVALAVMMQQEVAFLQGACTADRIPRIISVVCGTCDVRCVCTSDAAYSEFSICHLVMVERNWCWCCVASYVLLLWFVCYLLLCCVFIYVC